MSTSRIAEIFTKEDREAYKKILVNLEAVEKALEYYENIQKNVKRKYNIFKRYKVQIDYIAMCPMLRKYGAIEPFTDTFPELLVERPRNAGWFWFQIETYKGLKQRINLLKRVRTRLMRKVYEFE